MSFALVAAWGGRALSKFTNTRRTLWGFPMTEDSSDTRTTVLSRRERRLYALTLKAMTDEQLFEAWSLEYNARRDAHAALIVAEMDSRQSDIEVIIL